MSTNLTYNIRLICESQADHDKIVKTLELHRDVYNHMSRDIFETKVYDKKLIHDNNYHPCRKLFPETPSQVIIRAKDAVYATYKTLRSNKQLESLKSACEMTNLAMRLDKRLYTFLENGIKLSTYDKRVVCGFKPYPKFEDMFSKYSIGDPLLFEKDGELWLAVSFKIPEPTHVENSVLGVDLGVKRTATTSEGVVVHDKEFLTRKRKLRYLKRQLQSKTKTSDSSSAKRKLKTLKRKERNRNKKYCEHIANKILETKSNTIVLEDLSSLKKKNLGKKAHKRKSYRNMLAQVPFFMLLQILTYKAPLSGKKVVTVNPAYTSKDDHRGIRRGKRKGCRYYTSDGLVFDADWNAAINIAARHASKHDPQLPVSSRLPLDGRLDFTGRLPSTNQSCNSDQICSVQATSSIGPQAR